MLGCHACGFAQACFGFGPRLTNISIRNSSPIPCDQRIMACMPYNANDQPPASPHRKTCKRYNLAGHAHALTFSCFRRQPFLSKDRSRLWFTDAVERAREKQAFHLWAYVVMPEHVHLLVWPTHGDYNVSEILNSVKLSVVKRALTFVRQEAPSFLAKMEDRQPKGKVHYRFWQRGGG
jgi:putative transposase